MSEEGAAAPDRAIGTVIFKAKSGEEFRFQALPLVDANESFRGRLQSLYYLSGPESPPPRGPIGS